MLAEANDTVAVSSNENEANPAQSADFTEYLRNELLRRCKANPNYSLRAFARSLQIEPSALSKILKGKRQVTPSTFNRLAERLALDPSSIEQLAPPLKRRRRSSSAETTRYQSISLDAFEVISDWYHFAILELTQLRDFNADPRWIARRLSITPSEVNIAMERMQRLGLLEVTAEGRWLDRSGAVTVYKQGMTSAALRKLQHQVLTKALAALEEVPIERRDHTSMTMAINTARIPEARDLITRFRREICSLLKNDQDIENNNLDQVYNLSIALYPISENKAE